MIPLAESKPWQTLHYYHTKSSFIVFGHLFTQRTWSRGVDLKTALVTLNGNKVYLALAFNWLEKGVLNL